MATIKCVIHIASGELRNVQGALEYGPFEPRVADPAFAVVVLPDGSPTPDQRVHLWGGSALVQKSAPAIATYDAAALDAQSLSSSRKKDILASIALVVRSRDIAGWNTMTTNQKVTATLAEADVWKAIRTFIDDKV